MTDHTRSAAIDYRSGSLSLPIVALCLLFISGCPSDPAPGPTPGGGNGNGKSSSGMSRANCETQLSTVWNKVQPDRLDFKSKPEDVADGLSRWLRGDCGKVPKNTDGRLKGIEDLMFPAEPPTDFAKLLESTSFLPRDAGHIRNAIIFRSLSQSDLIKASDDATRAAKLFQAICNLVSIAKPLPDGEALTPYEIILRGRGTAADRAWLFAEALQQFRIPAVILTTTPDDLDGSPWLVGVPLDGDAMLFDPLSGRAVSARGSEETSTPATLSDLLASPDQYPSAGGTQDWKNCTIGQIGHGSWWSLRMAAIDDALTADRNVVVHINAAKQLEQILADGHPDWTAERIQIWSYPEQQMQIATGPDSSTPRIVIDMNERLQMPLIRSEKLVGVWENTDGLKRARLMHASGEVGSAIRAYQAALTGISLSEEHVTLAERDLGEQAKQDVAYWTGVAQSQLDDNGAAIGIWRQSLRATGTEGRWVNETLLALAERYAADERYASAIRQVENIERDSPLRKIANELRKEWPTQPDETPESDTTETPSVDEQERSGDKNAENPVSAPRP